jgi:hypothetical protein
VATLLKHIVTIDITGFFIVQADNQKIPSRIDILPDTFIKNGAQRNEGENSSLSHAPTLLR